MGGNAEKTKFSIRVDTDLVELADTYIRSSTVKNRTELIEDALRFYLGFLTAQKAEDYLLQSLSSVMTGTVQDSENRLARMDFKIAVLAGDGIGPEIETFASEMPGGSPTHQWCH